MVSMIFFSRCLCLFNKLWNEMKAQMLDFERVLLALKDSLIFILNDLKKAVIDYSNLNTEFKSLTENWKYDLLKQGKKEKTEQEPVNQLNAILTNEVISMIKPKKMHNLCKGEVFEMKILNKERKGKTKQSLWKLSLDLKELNFTDSDNSDGDSKILIKNIVTLRKEKNQNHYQINLTAKSYLDEQTEETYILSNNSTEIIETWTDGLNMLIDPKPNANIKCLVECLVDTQLLDLKTLGFIIPNTIPKIPQLPDNFDFLIENDFTHI